MVLSYFRSFPTFVFNVHSLSRFGFVHFVPSKPFSRWLCLYIGLHHYKVPVPQSESCPSPNTLQFLAFLKATSSATERPKLGRFFPVRYANARYVRIYVCTRFQLGIFVSTLLAAVLEAANVVYGLPSNTKHKPYGTRKNTQIPLNQLPWHLR